ncbi:MAG: M20/M25/M40 family metallo-hydrolase, partial [Candidatus Cloacimonetes bacterium]|nr:M20/M25/M40 family metallo-hydrolase [Candidatus Cloacimonadota bacterium]
YALHVKGDIPVGTVSTKPGIFFANTEEIDVLFEGIGAHVALAERGKDALNAGFEFYRLVNEKVRENFEDQKTILCKFGKMTAGTVRNTIAAECKLEGTIRALSEEDHNLLRQIVKESVDEISQKYNIKSEFKNFNYYKALMNNEKLYEKFKGIIGRTNYKFKEADVLMGGEDFGFFAEKYTGLFFWLGANQGEVHDLHSSNFLPDEKAINVGVDVFFELIK